MMDWLAKHLRLATGHQLLSAADSLPGPLADSPLAGRLREVGSKLADDSGVVIAVAGQYSSGKSTFLNCVLGREVLFTEVPPTTDVPTLLRHCPIEQAEIVMESGERMEVPSLDSLEVETARCREDGAISRRVVWSPRVPPGCTFVDTPGLNSGEIGHTEVAERVVRNADILLYLCEWMGVDEQDCQFIASYAGQSDSGEQAQPGVAEPAKRLLLVISKADALRPSDRSRVKALCTEVVSERCSGVRLEATFCLSPRELLAEVVTGGPGPWSATFDALMSALRGLTAECQTRPEDLATVLRDALDTLNQAISGLAAEARERERYLDQLHALGERVGFLSAAGQKWAGTVHTTCKSIAGQVPAWVSLATDQAFGPLHQYMETHSRDSLNSTLQGEIERALGECCDSLHDRIADAVGRWADRLEDDYEEREMSLPAFPVAKVARPLFRVAVEPQDQGGLFGAIFRDLLGGYKWHFEAQIRRNLDANKKTLADWARKVLHDWRAATQAAGAAWHQRQLDACKEEESEIRQLIGALDHVGRLDEVRGEAARLSRLLAFCEAARAYAAADWSGCIRHLAGAECAGVSWASAFLRGCAHARLQDGDAALLAFGQVNADDEAPQGLRIAAQVNAALLQAEAQQRDEALVHLSREHAEAGIEQVLAPVWLPALRRQVERVLASHRYPHDALGTLAELAPDGPVVAACLCEAEGRFEAADRLLGASVGHSTLASEMALRAAFRHGSGIRNWSAGLRQLYGSDPDCRHSGLQRLRWRMGQAAGDALPGSYPLPPVNIARGRVVDDCIAV